MKENSQIVADSLRSQIRSGVLEPGSRLPSFLEFRDQGISQTSAEQIYDRLQEEGLIRRVRGNGVFVAQLGLETRKGALGFLINDVSTALPYYLHLLKGVREVARREGQELLLLDDAAGARVDGLLMQSVGIEALRRRLPETIPAVVLGAPAQGLPSVNADDFAGARGATEYLLSLGHHRIGYLIDIVEGGVVPRNRFDGYRAALTEAGVKFDIRWLGHMTNYGEMAQRGYIGMRDWMNGNWKKLGCTALLVQNDRAAIGAMQALQQNGYRVPEDVSVIGFDGTDECELATPHLTSVEVPLRQMGVQAAELLLAMIRQESLECTTNVWPTELRVRDSTAPID